MSRLPLDAVARLQRHLEPVTLRRKDVLFLAHEPLRSVYFPVTAVISLVTALDSGAVMETGLVGCDGVAGLAVLPGLTTMPCDAVVDIAGVAYRMDAEELRRQAERDRAIAAALGQQVSGLLARSMQSILCNRFHSVEQRCVRRLLQLSELIDSSELPVTHESLAAALGVRRPTVTLTMGALRRAGLVAERRGRVTIRNRAGLEAACCECCRAMLLEPIFAFS